MARTAAQQAPALRGLRQQHNPANAASDSVPVLHGSLQLGIVYRTGVGIYDAEVRINDNRMLPCHQLTTMMNRASGIGVTHAELIPELTPVLVWVPSVKDSFGIILSTVPNINMSTISQAAGDPPPRQYNAQADAEPGAAESTEATFNAARKDPKVLNMLVAQSGRPSDMFQGDYALTNEMGLGVWLRRIMCSVKASDRAKLEMFLLDELVRMVSSQFQHFSSLGEEHIYNSNGRVTMELSGSGHQCEVQGQTAFGKKAFQNATGDAALRDAGIATTGTDPAMLRRFQLLLGHMGGLAQFFVMQPDPSAAQGVMGDKTTDQGLLHIGMGSNGDLLMRSAGDIVLQRSDRIPVPKKLKEPWDPSGDNADKLAVKTPYVFSEDGAEGHTPELRNALAWQNRTMYGEVLANRDGGNWHLPEESAMHTPQDQYDKISGDTEAYSDNKDNTCRVVLRKDGGITLQDNDGAEISLVGGKVIITAPNGVEIRSGTNVVTTAQTDVITKAKNSIDLTATTRDVRIKAEKNCEMRATGLLIESSATEDSPVFTGKGEDVKLTGINLKADNSRIFLLGAKVHLAGVADVIIEAVETSFGAITLAANRIIGAAKTQLNMLLGDSSGLMLSEGLASVVGKSAMLRGTDSVQVLEQTQAWIPFQKVDIGADISQLTAIFSSEFGMGWSSLGETFTWLGAYRPSARDSILFTYRTPEQYDTDSETFRVYESLWAFIARTTGSVAAEWDEPVVEGTTPWPGITQYEGGTAYRRLAKEPNIQDAKTGIPVDFDSRTATGAQVQGASFKQYVG